jgi:ubiquinone/menaquinone biosynthesis C-methylase UbiE
MTDPKIIPDKLINEFDTKAAEWDSTPMHWDRSKAIANEIKKLIPLKTEMTALEYGAGTGITSFLLKDFLKEIIMMDNSSEMVKIMNNKINATKVNNLKALNFDLEHADYIGGKFDLIFTQMVLHHVTDIETIITRFSQLLNKGGFLAIADLYEEDGSFHGEGFIGHRGFNLENLSGILRKKRFKNISHTTCYVIDRIISEIETEHFEVFLLVSTRV